MLETGAKVGTSTRIVGAKHALVPVELIVSGAPVGAPELGKHVGSFQGAFEVVVLRPERQQTRWKQVRVWLCALQHASPDVLRLYSRGKINRVSRGGRVW